MRNKHQNRTEACIAPINPTILGHRWKPICKRPQPRLDGSLCFWTDAKLQERMGLFTSLTAHSCTFGKRLSHEHCNFLYNYSAPKVHNIPFQVDNQKKPSFAYTASEDPQVLSHKLTLQLWAKALLTLTSWHGQPTKSIERCYLIRFGRPSNCQEKE